jgi:hypothetical protein
MPASMLIPSNEEAAASTVMVVDPGADAVPGPEQRTGTGDGEFRGGRPGGGPAQVRIEAVLLVGPARASVHRPCHDRSVHGLLPVDRSAPSPEFGRHADSFRPARGSGIAPGAAAVHSPRHADHPVGADTAGLT